MAQIPILADAPQYDNPPEVRFDLGPTQSKVLKGMKPGDTIRMVVRGTIRDLSMHEPYDDMKKGFVGTCTIEAKSMEFAKSNLEFEALLDD